MDEDAAARGKTVYIAQCITCHGTRARGGPRGADLVRSLVVLHDRYGNTIGPYLAKGHPVGHPVTLTQEQIVDLSHFLHQQVGDTLRTGPYNNVLNILVGDPKEGKAFFYGAGGCSHCHSPTGDLAHIASKYDPPNLQLKVVFPQDRAVARNGPATPRKPLTVTVTTASGESVTGVPTELDDFNVSLFDAAGQYHSFARGPGVKVGKHDPYAVMWRCSINTLTNTFTTSWPTWRPLNEVLFGPILAVLSLARVEPERYPAPDGGWILPCCRTRRLTPGRHITAITPAGVSAA